MATRLDAEYILPLRWSDDRALDDLVDYLTRLADRVDVTVVDGSPADLRAGHAARFPATVRILEPDAALGANGKAAAVNTAVQHARHERIVIADDDVRYSHRDLELVVARLDDAGVVRPQNVFSPLPWHARWDSARSLFNRAFGSDYPGTLAVRREYIESGYDGDALFENLELIRTVVARGGVEDRADDVFVRRIPPSPRTFWSQRPRQAYDSIAQPGRLMLELAILPLALVAVSRRWRLGLAAAPLVAVAVAEVGRRRAGGVRVFPSTAALWAPLWVSERAVCSWLALGARLRGGARYRGQRLTLAANSAKEIRRRETRT